MSAFSLWHPHFSPNHQTLQVYSLNGDVTGGINQDDQFITQVLSDLGVQQPPAHYTFRPFRTKYYSYYVNEADWQDNWVLLWKVQIDLTVPLTELPKYFDAYIDTDAYGENWVDEPAESEPITCLVMANAPTSTTLHTCIDQLKHNFDTTGWRFEVFEYVEHGEHGQQYAQLEIDLGKFPSQFFADGAPLATQVMAVCERHGASVHDENIF
jgi:hypothetical protein